MTGTMKTCPMKTSLQRKVSDIHPKEMPVSLEKRLILNLVAACNTNVYKSDRSNYITFYADYKFISCSQECTRQRTRRVLSRRKFEFFHDFVLICYKFYVWKFNIVKKFILFIYSILYIVENLMILF